MLSVGISSVFDSSGWSWRLARSKFWALMAIALSAPLGILAAYKPKYALGAGLLLFCIGLFTINVRFFATLAFPATLLVLRVGAGSGLSASDFILFAATVTVFPLFRIHESRTMRRLLWLLAVYESTTLLTVVYNPYRADAIEWVHEAMLVGGSLIVGWVVGSTGNVRAGLRAFLAGSCGLAVWAALGSVQQHFQPVNLSFGMQKNFIGSTLAFAVVLTYGRPTWTGLSGRWSKYIIGICLVGILASQSRQAMIATVVGIGVFMFRGGQIDKRSKVALIAMAPLIGIAYFTLKSQLASHNKFNSVNQRLTWYHQSLIVWHASPVFGSGLRWWYTNKFPFAFQPPNAEVEMITSAGVVGTLGFLILVIGALVLVYRIPPEFGTLAFAFLLMRVVEGQLDIFWVAPAASTPWLVIGLSLGVMGFKRAEGSLAKRSPEPLLVPAA